MKVLLVLEANEVRLHRVLELLRNYPEAELGETPFLLSRATCQDLRESGALEQVPRFGPCPETYVKLW